MANGGRTILVTGATGKQGGAVARELLDRGYDVRAMTRKPDSEPARALRERHATVVQGDLNDPASLERVLDDVWGVLALQNTWEAGVEVEEEQGKRIAQLASRAGVHHYVYHSVASADRDTGIPHFDNKYRIEDTVRSLGFPSWTIIRPVFFMENLLGPGFKEGIDSGAFAMGIEPDTPLQVIAVADIGRYGFLAFDQHEQMNGREIDIAGDELTTSEIARILGDVTGRTITFEQQPIEAVRSFSQDMAAMYEWFDEVGYDVDIEANAREFGIQPTRFREWAAAQHWS